MVVASIHLSRMELLIICIAFFIPAPDDYTSLVQLLTFNPGESTVQVTVPVVNDAILEIDENFFGNLRVPAGSPFIGSITFQPGRAMATILDDDCKWRCIALCIGYN